MDLFHGLMPEKVILKVLLNQEELQFLKNLIMIQFMKFSGSLTVNQLMNVFLVQLMEEFFGGIKDQKNQFQ